MKKLQLEIACFNLQSALIAEQNGVDRVELCANMQDGGTTPSGEFVDNACQKLAIKINVMIRPRGGNFVYTNEEFEQMKAEIITFKTKKVAGFVFGILDNQGKINSVQNAALVQLAKPLPCTFHRAFDILENKKEGLETIINCGFKTLLTSGVMTNVVDGTAVLEVLVKQANGRIVIMPGGGLRSTNITSLLQKTQATFYHSSAITDTSETASAIEIQALVKKIAT